MTVFLRRNSLIAGLLISALVFVPMHAVEARSLDHTGEMRMKLERIGQGDPANRQAEAEGDKETELEKSAPDLFKEQTRTDIQAIQQAREEMTETLQNSLFITQSDQDTTLRDTETVLFASDYTAPSTTTVAGNNEGNNSSEMTSGTVFTALLGLVFAICGGIYALMRRTFE